MQRHLPWGVDARDRRRTAIMIAESEADAEAEVEAEGTLGGSELITPPPELRALRHVGRAVVVGELLPLADLPQRVEPNLHQPTELRLDSRRYRCSTKAPPCKT